MTTLVVSGIPVGFSERLMTAYRDGSISRHRMLCAIEQEGLDFTVYDTIELITFLDNLREGKVKEKDDVTCRCDKPGYISLDPYDDDVLGELVFDVYCDECYDEDCDEI
jgi:hypothetical protein